MYCCCCARMHYFLLAPNEYELFRPVKLDEDSLQEIYVTSRTEDDDWIPNHQRCEMKPKVISEPVPDTVLAA